MPDDISNIWQGNPETPKPARGIILTVPQMAQFLGCSGKTIRELIEAGAPIYERGSRGSHPHKLNSHDFMQWRDAWRDSQKPPGRPKANGNGAVLSRLEEIRIQKAEIDLQERMGDLIHMDDWKPFIEDEMVTMRQYLVTNVRNNMTSRFGSEVGNAARDENAAALNSYVRSMNRIPEMAREKRRKGNSRSAR